ncbi:DUF4158 domain-containing protein [Ensifer sp. BR816]|uniref:DUF4158 domain-containing protein n=1 Tax=Rhizobium sp. (strain BR816) TaxID=1057002 RepID=UPI00039AAAD3|nr:DUF4158 domain-containing protein [Ensifer sp. BR816]
MSDLPSNGNVDGQKLGKPRNGRLSDMDFRIRYGVRIETESRDNGTKSTAEREIWWQQATTIPEDEREIAKHCTLDRPDLDLIMRQNKASNRLGLVCVMALLRYPGRPLADGEILPAGVLRFLARKIGVDHHEIERYFERPQTRREHLALLFDRMKLRPFAPADVKALTGWLTPATQTLRQADALADMVVEELRRRRILLPARPALEAILHLAIRRGVRIAHRALAGGLSEGHKLDLDRLLDPREGTSVTVLAWAVRIRGGPPCRNCRIWH